jgi:S1-C subfamily serine protease
VNLDDISTQLLFTTVPLWVKKPQGTVTGTGFIYNVPVPGDATKLIPLLITNFHVVEGALEAVIELVERKGDAPLLQSRVRAQLNASVLLATTDQRLDLAIVPLGPLLNQLEASGRPAFFRAIGPEIIPSATVVNDLAAVEEIVFIGYPSGLRDEHNSTPLVRRGITASPVWNDFGNEPVFLIDAGVYPGSSGSPVFILNQGSYPTRTGLAVGTRLLFLGLITSTMLRTESAGNAYLGLGRVVKASAIAPTIDAFVRSVQSSTEKQAGTPA